MTERPDGEPTIERIREAQIDIVGAGDLSADSAFALGQNLMRAELEFYQAWKLMHPQTALIDERIKHIKILLDNLLGNRRVLGGYLRNRAIDLQTDPAWLVSASEDMQFYPGKLLEVADLILASDQPPNPGTGTFE